MSNGQAFNCSDDNSTNRLDVLVYSTGAANAAGIVICVASIALAVCLKLHRRLIYRLAIYQVAGAVSYGTTAIIDVIQLLFMRYGKDRAINMPLCLTNAYLNTYTLLVVLFFTIITTVHLFMFAVFYKNLKRLEVCYFTLALVLPAVIAAVPFATKTYGQQFPNQPWCWIVLYINGCSMESRSTAAIVEVFTLYLGTGLVTLLTLSSLVVVMLVVLRWRSRVMGVNKVAIKQIIPLVVYPITSCVLIIVLIGRYVYDSLPIAARHRLDQTLSISDQVANACFLWTAGLYFLLHILVVVWTKRSRRVRYRAEQREEEIENSRLVN